MSLAPTRRLAAGCPEVMVGGGVADGGIVERSSAAMGEPVARVLLGATGSLHHAVEGQEVCTVSFMGVQTVRPAGFSSRVRREPGRPRVPQRPPRRRCSPPWIRPVEPLRRLHSHDQRRLQQPRVAARRGTGSRDDSEASLSRAGALTAPQRAHQHLRDTRIAAKRDLPTNR